MASWPRARSSGWFCTPPAGETRTRRCTRSGAACATSRLTGQPIELPTRTALSISSASRTATRASARAGMSSTRSRRWLRPYPGRSGTTLTQRAGEPACRGHQVGAGDREAVDVDDRYAGPTRAAPAVDDLARRPAAARSPNPRPSTRPDRLTRSDGARSCDEAQAQAVLTSLTTFFSTAGLHCVRAYDTGQMSPSSRFAASWKPRVEYRYLNLPASWKKTTTWPSAFA